MDNENKSKTRGIIESRPAEWLKSTDGAAIQVVSLFPNTIRIDKEMLEIR